VLKIDVRPILLTAAVLLLKIKPAARNSTISRIFAWYHSSMGIIGGIEMM
jgi:hypothetical protein